MFHARFDDLPRITNYRTASAVEAGIKPIRGRTPECKPLGKRSKTHINIRKENDTIKCRLYQTDVLTYYADGRIEICLDGWASQTTLGFIEAVSGMGAMRRHGRIWLQARARAGGSTVYGWFPLHTHAPNFLRYDLETCNRIFENPETFTTHKINRKGVNNVRKVYRAFRDYIVQTMRVRDNGFSGEEFGEMFGWKESIAGIEGRAAKLPVDVGVVGYLKPNGEAITNFLALTRPTTNAATQTMNFYKASLILAHSAGAWWGGACRPTEYSMLKGLHNAMLFHHKDECFTEEPAPAGVAVKDAYEAFF